MLRVGCVDEEKIKRLTRASESESEEMLVLNENW